MTKDIFIKITWINIQTCVWDQIQHIALNGIIQDDSLTVDVCAVWWSDSCSIKLLMCSSLITETEGCCYWSFLLLFHRWCLYFSHICLRTVRLLKPLGFRLRRNGYICSGVSAQDHRTKSVMCSDWRLEDGVVHWERATLAACPETLQGTVYTAYI